MAQKDLSLELDKLREIWRSARDQVDAQYQRTLPFADYVVDRWEKARLLGFGAGSSIYDSALILGDVKVGEDTWIGPFTVIDGSGGLTIGSHCAISAGVHIYTHDTVDRILSGGQLPTVREATRIGSCVYIGPNAVITKGVTIGDCCVIGANSLVLHDVPSGSIAYGNPCEIRGQIEVPTP